MDYQLKVLRCVCLKEGVLFGLPTRGVCTYMYDSECETKKGR